MSTEEGKLINLTGELAPRGSKDVESLTRTSEFLPQVRVYGSESTIVKEGKFPMGHLGLYYSADRIVDLGDQVNCLCIDWRPRVSIVLGDAPISFFGQYSEEEGWSFSEQFDEVKARAMSKEQGYMAGLEYLLWFPDIDAYGLFLMGNPTLRRESPNLKALTGNAATLKIKLIKTSKYTWHGVSVFRCTTPFDPPDQNELIEQVRNFRNPKDSKVELADDSDSSRAR